MRAALWRTKFDGHLTGVRRLFLSRVGYFIYYSANAQDLEILAFWHSSRAYQPRL